MTAPELILRNARMTTLDPQNPQSSAVAIAGGRFIVVGTDDDVMRLATASTRGWLTPKAGV